MNKKHRRILRYTVGGVLLGTSITAGMILAAPTPSRQTPLIVSSEKKGQVALGRCELPPATGGMICTPNSRNGGYFEGTWRVWPTQTRTDVHFPEAVLRTPVTPAAKHPTGTLSGIPDIYVPPEIDTGMGGALRLEDVDPPMIPPVRDDVLPVNPPNPGGVSPGGGIDIDNPIFNGLTGNGNDGNNGVGTGTNNGEIDDDQVKVTVGHVIGGGIGPAPPKTGYTTQEENDDFDPPSPMPEMKTQEDFNRSIEGIVPGQGYETPGTSYDMNPQRGPVPDYVQEPFMTAPASVSTPTAAAAPVPPALEGFCPVSLLQTEQWIKGDPRYQVTYNGKTYLLSSQGKVHEFLADPRRYTPVMNGNDPVEMRSGRQIVGLADFCLVYEGRLYMFASEDAMNEFSANAKDLRDFADYTERMMQE